MLWFRTKNYRTAVKTVHHKPEYNSIGLRKYYRFSRTNYCGIQTHHLPAARIGANTYSTLRIRSFTIFNCENMFDKWLNIFSYFPWFYFANWYWGLANFIWNVWRICRFFLYILYADDTVLVAESAQKFQNQLLNHFENYRKKWNLNCNIEKSKLLIFSKKKKKIDCINCWHSVIWICLIHVRL